MKMKLSKVKALIKQGGVKVMLETPVTLTTAGVTYAAKLVAEVSKDSLLSALTAFPFQTEMEVFMTTDMVVVIKAHTPGPPH